MSQNEAQADPYEEAFKDVISNVIPRHETERKLRKRIRTQAKMQNLAKAYGAGGGRLPEILAIFENALR